MINTNFFCLFSLKLKVVNAFRMGLDARYDSEQRKSLSAIAFKARQSQSLEYADADIDSAGLPSRSPPVETSEGDGTPPGKRTEHAVLH